MRLLEADGRFSGPTRLLLAAVSGVPQALLAVVRVRSKDHNWLRFPWYSEAKGGGAFVLGDRIFVHPRLLQQGERRACLLLLAHEVGHLPHAAHFGFGGLGRTRFVLWAAGQYLGSALRHGRHAHREAQMEQEAERGRWVLTALLRATTNDPPFLALEEVAAMLTWLHRHASLIEDLHRRYPGWRA